VVTTAAPNMADAGTRRKTFLLCGFTVISTLLQVIITAADKGQLNGCMTFKIE
jgi:hypothetical protein